MATLHIGSFEAVETVMCCGSCPGQPSFRSRELSGLVSEGCNFGHDVMVQAGRSLFQWSRSVEDTVAGMAGRNVRISPSEVRLLAARFVVSLGMAHAESAPAIREMLGINGGYVLHMDSTCRKGSSHLMTGLDEISGLVLLNVKMGSENGADTEEFLKDMLKWFGFPAAVSCDMSPAILSALEKEAECAPRRPGTFRRRQ